MGMMARLNGRGGRWILGVALAALVLAAGLAALAHFWLPGYAKTKLEQVLSGQLKRPVSIGQVTLSAYPLSAGVSDLRAGDVLSVGSIRLDLAAASLFGEVPQITRLQIDQPKLHLVRQSATRLNVSDLLDEWAKPGDAPTPQFSVSNITLNGGEIEWVDQVVRQTQTLSQIHLGLPFIANTPSQADAFVEPAFSARLDGAELRLSGQVRPFSAGQEATLELALQDFDLTRISPYFAWPLKLESARLTTRLQLQFQHPHGGANALRLTGDLAVKHFKAELPAQKLALAVPQIDLAGLHADVFGQTATARRLTLAGAHEGAALSRDGRRFLHWQALNLERPVLDAKAHRVAAAELHWDAPELALERLPSGQLDLQAAFAPVPAASSAPTAVPTAAPTANPSPVWHTMLDKLALSAGKLHFTDRAHAEAHTLDFSEINLTAGKWSSEVPQPLPLQLNLTVNERGSLAAEGTATQDGQADFKLSARQLDLVALQGWLPDTLNAVLTRGNANFSGEVHAAAGQFRLAGDLQLNDVNVLDRLNSEDMLRWKQLRLDRLALNSQPFALDIGEISLRDFFAQLLVNAKGQLNLKGIVRESSAGTQAASRPAEPAAGLPVRVGKITLSGGAVDYNDEFIKPNFSAHLSGLNGSIGALAAGQQSSVEISGKVDRSAPVHIAGWADPLARPLSLNLQASARGVDLPNLSAYSGRYLGYAIEKGKLSMDVSYLIDKGELTAQNKLFLDQLTLGEKVDSPSALDLPIGLAIALLKNADGEINLDLPISGSLNDPQFNVGGIVFKVLVNVMAKAITSPFALLGALFGSDEVGDLSSVSFGAGSSDLSPEIVAKLQTLSKAMAERPHLKMEVTAYADPAVDQDGLKRAFLLRKLKVRKLADSARQGKATASLDETGISPEEYPLWLEKVYRSEEFAGKPKNVIGLQKTLPQAEMEALLLAQIEVSQDDLMALAEARGSAVQDWLTGSGGVAMERVFLLSGRVGAAKSAGADNRVAFELR